MYGHGSTSDPRFSLANERTFLAWVRTSLALLAGGVALDAVELDGPQGLQSAQAVTLVVLGLLGAGVSWLRWAATERAMRLRRPLPGTAALAWLAVVLRIVAARTRGAGPLTMENAGDQLERKLLAWRRTALSLFAAGLLVAHLAARDVGRAAPALNLIGTAAAVALVWLSHHRRTGAAGLGLILGALLLGAVALLGVATR